MWYANKLICEGWFELFMCFNDCLVNLWCYKMFDFSVICKWWYEAGDEGDFSWGLWLSAETCKNGGAQEHLAACNQEEEVWLKGEEQNQQPRQRC